MRILSAREAVRNHHRSEGYSLWSAVGTQSANLGYEDASGVMGGARVFNGKLAPQLAPKFKIPFASSIFASGSCFAREIEHALDQAGERVLSWTPKVTVPNHFFHRYNTFSIANDFIGAIDGIYDERLMMDTSAGWIDYSFYGPTETKQQLVEFRNEVFNVHRAIAEANILIITLGLIEVWFDKQTEKHLNFAPSEVLSSNLGRYECRITNYEENLNALVQLIGSVRRLCKNDLKIVLTVSPVPLNVTFSGQDVVVANMLSKSTLRAVAQAMADSDPNLDYFPSYEMAMMSDPREVWLPDHRHVRREFVMYIVDTFLKAYMRPDEHAAQA
jgi:hypothetical protein